MRKSTQLNQGDKFNRLTVIKLHHIKKNIRNQNIEYYLCKCVCGNECIICKNDLKTKHTQSCGCLCKENTIKKNNKHILSNSKIYKMWTNIKTRCYNKNINQFKDYGGRGITVCKEWLDKESGFISFYNWSILNGYIKNEGLNLLSIDRIDNNKGYSPKNCRFITRKKQNRNQRSNININYNNENHCISEWAEILNINYYTLIYRLKHWSIKKSFTNLV